MTMTTTPDPEKIRRYRVNRRPYVEVTRNERKLHARVIGWHENMILVEYPPTIIDKYTHGQRSTEWINKSLAVRIRKADSLWATLDDNAAWHDLQDQKITHRADPWNIYEQEFHD